MDDMLQQENFIWYNPAEGIPVVSVGPSGISINASCHRTMGQPERILIGIDPQAGLLAIKPALDDEAGAVPLNLLRKGAAKTTRKSVIRMIREHWPRLPDGRTVRYVGRWDDGRQMLVVDLSRPLAESRAKPRD